MLVHQRVSILVSDPHDIHQDLSIAAIFPKKNLLGHALVATMLLPATVQLLQRSSPSPKNYWLVIDYSDS